MSRVGDKVIRNANHENAERRRNPHLPEAVKRFHQFAGKEGAFPHPSLVLEKFSAKLMKAYNETLRLRATGDPAAKESRRAYMTLLADELMNQNPFEKERRGPSAFAHGAS